MNERHKEIIGRAIYLRKAVTLSRHDRERPRDGAYWFTPSEMALVAAIAELIVPADESSPGARDARVAERLSQNLAVSQDPLERRRYAAGLLAFDELARRAHGARFVDLTAERQFKVLQEVAQAHEAWSKGAGSTKARLCTLARQIAVGVFPAIWLYHFLLRDVFGAFYASQVAWDWLGYDGPPFTPDNLIVLERAGGEPRPGPGVTRAKL